MTKKKQAAAWLAAIALTAVFAMPGQAATKKNDTETRTPISTVTLNVTSQVEDGDDYGYILATGTSDEYSIGSYDWGNSAQEWKMGDEPKVKISLHARSGYYFNKTTGKNKVTVNGAEFSSAKIDDNKETLIVTVKLTPVSGTLEDPEDVEWVGYPVGKAEWSQTENAEAYELTLYRDNVQVYSVEKMIGTSYDFFPQMTKEGEYYFRIRSVPRDTEEAAYLQKSDWVYSDRLTVDDDETPQYKYDWNVGTTHGPSAPLSGWQKDSDGWWYANTDGSYPKDGWTQIGGKWYLFDNNGYMLTGWQNRGGKWYYLSVNGDMQTGWLQDNRIWYYLQSDGSAATGWSDIDGKRYYMSNDGAVLTGWWLIDGNWHYFDKTTGQMAVNTRIGNYNVDQNGIWRP